MLDALDERDAIDATYLYSLVLRADQRPFAGGTTAFASRHAKASCYVELAPGYGRNGEKCKDDGIVRSDLLDVLRPLSSVLDPCERIQRALDHCPGLYKPGESVESKVDSTGH